MTLRQAVEHILAERPTGVLCVQQGQITADSDAFVAECGEFPGYVQVSSCELVLTLEQLGVIGTVDELVKRHNESFELVR